MIRTDMFEEILTMRKIELDELKRIEFELLCCLDEVCKKNAIKYSLAYGTLLGAVRHKEFIPWDDDVDVFMMRNDYEHFLRVCSEGDVPFKLVSHGTCEWYNYPFSKIYDDETVLKEKNTYFDGKLGVFIDIFPIDPLGKTEKEAEKNYKKTAFVRELITASNWKRFFRSKTRSVLIEPVRLFFYLASRLTDPKKLLRKLEKPFLEIEESEAKFFGSIYSPYRIKEIAPSEIYEWSSKVEFEGRTFCSIKNPEAYLTKFYGDYMKLPPEEKRVSHHLFEAWSNK